MQTIITIIFVLLILAIPFVFYGGARLILKYQRNYPENKKKIYTKKDLLNLLANSFYGLFTLIILQFAFQTTSSPPKLKENNDPIETILDVEKRIIYIEAYADKMESYLFFRNTMIYSLIGLAAIFTLIPLVYIIISLPIPLDEEEKHNE